jgi:uncharacterized membrane protein
MAVTVRQAEHAVASALDAGRRMFKRGLQELGGDHKRDGQDGREKQALTRAKTIRKTPEELANLLRNPEAVDQMMTNLAQVTRTGPDRMRWKFRGRGTPLVEFETKIVDERPGQEMTWETVEGASVPHRITCRFKNAPADRGTEVYMEFRALPADDIKLPIGEFAPELMLRRLLRRLQALAESGEVPTIAYNPSARPNAPEDLI